MHMADALVSPAVGGSLWAVTAGVTAWCSRRVRTRRGDRLIPMMGVLGAFVFAAQMINVSIPGTGSSGHIGGGLLLAILLGPHAAFLVMASILTVQAFFFADGGLLALGCNIVNLGLFPAFVAFPLVYRPLAGTSGNRARLGIAAMVAAVVGLQLGAFSVVLQTYGSGLSDLPFKTFLWLMQPIHLAIGLMEGLATAAILSFLARVQPDALTLAVEVPSAHRYQRRLLAGFLLAAIVCGGAAGWVASTHPDGLEWAVAKITGKPEPAAPAGRVHTALANLQTRTALFSGYRFSTATRRVPDATATPSAALPGVLGGAVTLAAVLIVGTTLKTLRRAPR